MYTEYQPSHLLAPYIDNYWEFKGNPEYGMRIHILPDGCTDFIFTLGEVADTVEEESLIMQPYRSYFVRPMTKYSELVTYSTIWMSTGTDSLKTIDFRKNPKAGLCFQNKGDSVALTGTVEVVTDERMKKELWQDWFIEHFPGGPIDPGYVLLKFESNHATYWIEGTFIHKKLD